MVSARTAADTGNKAGSPMFFTRYLPLRYGVCSEPSYTFSEYKWELKLNGPMPQDANTRDDVYLELHAPHEEEMAHRSLILRTWDHAGSGDCWTTYRVQVGELSDRIVCKTLVRRLGLVNGRYPTLESCRQAIHGEIELYLGALYLLQGEVVPRFYGHWVGIRLAGMEAHAIILQDAGRAVASAYTLQEM